MKPMVWGRLGTSLILAMAFSSGVPQQSVKSPAQTEADAGLIDGTVIYEDGRPVKGATVSAEPLGRLMQMAIPHAETDESGYFAIHISRSWFGKFAVAAKKEDEDYPDMSMQFYSDGRFETVRLTSRHSAATVTIRLGPKAGVLLGTVADAVTNAPLNPCVEFRRGKNFSNFLSGTGLVNAKYRVLVPSNTDVLMKVWYGGHKSWYYPGTTEKAQNRPLNVKPGEETKIDIRLEPDPNAPSEGCGMPVGTVVNP